MISSVDSIEIVEVGPRDGLQNEGRVLNTAEKLQLINRSIEAGLRRIEVTSFVSPRKVPQLADADDLAFALPDRKDVTFIALVLNERGAERALGARIDQLGAVCIATDSFASANQGQTSNDSLAIAKRAVVMARSVGRTGQITIGGAFGCPFEGEVSPDRIVAMAAAAAEAEPVELSLADTIGVAVPSQVARLVARVRDAIAPIPVRVHFHDTRNTAIANVWAAVNAGATVVDASLGGLGGCPFAPGAAGNVPTEDVVYLFDRSGIATGIDLDQLIESSCWLGGLLGKSLPGKVARAPRFPVGNIK